MPGMISECSLLLHDNAARWDLTGNGQWSFLFHNNYHPHYSGINLFWFDQNREFPLVVTKICRERELLNREFRNLKHVQASAPQLVPRPLHFGQLSGFWTLWITGVPGYPLRNTHERSPEILNAVVDSLLCFNQPAQSATISQQERYVRRISEPLDALRHFGDSLITRSACDALVPRISPEWIASLPVVPQHGDFFLGNLLVDGKRFSIVDWENFGSVDLPLYDVFTFFLSLLQAGDARPEAWPRRITQYIPTLVDRYAATFGLSKQDSRLLLPLTLINWFHVLWKDGRQEFATRAYRIVESYLRDVDHWEEVMLGVFR